MIDHGNKIHTNAVPLRITSSTMILLEESPIVERLSVNLINVIYSTKYFYIFRYIN